VRRAILLYIVTLIIFAVIIYILYTHRLHRHCCGQVIFYQRRIYIGYASRIITLKYDIISLYIYMYLMPEVWRKTCLYGHKNHAPFPYSTTRINGAADGVFWNIFALFKLHTIIIYSIIQYYNLIIYNTLYVVYINICYVIICTE